MLKVSMAVATLGALALVPAAAFAQGRAGMAEAPKHELGVDVSMAFEKVGSCTTNCSAFAVSTPVDVRLGFLMSSGLSIEPRFTFNWVTGFGGHGLVFTPDVNVLIPFGTRSGQHGLMGPYVTGGASLVVTNTGVSGGASTSSTQFGLNVGVGLRRAWESAAFRPEAFFRYNFENTSKGIPSSFDIGARLGISFFH